MVRTKKTHRMKATRNEAVTKTTQVPSMNCGVERDQKRIEILIQKLPFQRIKGERA